jgi:hypothetical protein
LIALRTKASDIKKEALLNTGFPEKIKPMEKQAYVPGAMLGINESYRPCL